MPQFSAARPFARRVQPVPATSPSRPTDLGPRGSLTLLQQCEASFGLAVWFSVLLALCLATVPAAWGWNPSVVLSGSMSPAISTGDVVLIGRTSPENLRKGDVVLADLPGGGGRTYLHRIVDLRDNRVVTRGDANRANDQQPIAADAVHGRVRLVVPRIGWPMLWFSQPSAARSGAALIVALLLLASLVAMRPLWTSPAGRRRLP